MILISGEEREERRDSKRRRDVVYRPVQARPDRETNSWGQGGPGLCSVRGWSWSREDRTEDNITDITGMAS